VPLTDFAEKWHLGTRERLDLIARICDAVYHAHQKGVIHRDLKPGNILVDESGQPKILDFGVARAIDSDIQQTTLQTDIGQLVNAGNGGASQELFSLSQTDPLRVYVNVPEAYAPSIHTGLPAYLELTQYAGKKFEGKVVRTAESIELASRTLRVEVDVPNHAGELLPGGYAQVHLAVQVGGERVQVPVNALLFRAEGLRAIVVDANHKLRLQPITIGRDYGTTLEVLQGVTSSDWIVLNPADSLDDGQTVNVKEMAQKPAPPNPQSPVPAKQGAKPAVTSGASH
jgi:multidrug efflux pump subunit AcrA (membrane-fusion protein)